jgi:two-component system, cell cycle response regulator DivK
VTYRILVVEDNPDNMKLFAWILEDEGYEYQAVGSAEAALEVLSLRDFDLVLMDISLPGMDGKEATRRIRADSRLVGLPVIAVTAHAIKGEDEAILASGVSALVTKPIDEALLLETIGDLLRLGVTHG